MSKEEVRAKVMKLLNEYEGSEPEQLLGIIKENIEKENEKAAKRNIKKEV